MDNGQRNITYRPPKIYYVTYAGQYPGEAVESSRG